MYFKSNEDFAVLTEATFPAQALIGYRTMQRWGLIINCPEHQLGIEAEDAMNCLQSEDERFLPNRIHLAETSSTGEETVHTNTQQNQSVEVNKQNSTSDHTLNELVLSVQENTEVLDPSPLPEREDESSDESLYESLEVPCVYNEVAVLGSFLREEFAGFVENADLADPTQSEELGFLCEDEECPNVTMISTADDNTVTFRVRCGVQLRPGKLTKVHLCASNPQDLPEGSQVILLGDSLPESVRMDNSLVVTSVASCVTYVCNSTDKTLTLLTNQKFCRGILVTNPLVTIGEHSFIASNESRLENEINETDFPNYNGAY